MSGWIWLYWTVSVGLTVFVIITWHLTSRAVKKKTKEKLNPKKSDTASIYDEDGYAVHFADLGSHDLGGEVVVQSTGTADGARRSGASSSSLQAVGGAESV